MISASSLAAASIMILPFAAVALVGSPFSPVFRHSAPILPEADRILKIRSRLAAGQVTVEMGRHGDADVFISLIHLHPLGIDSQVQEVSSSQAWLATVDSRSAATALRTSASSHQETKAHWASGCSTTPSLAAHFP